MTPPRLTPTDLGIFRAVFAYYHRRGRLNDADYDHTVLVIDAAGRRLADLAAMDRDRARLLAVRGVYEPAGAR